VRPAGTWEIQTNIKHRVEPYLRHIESGFLYKSTVVERKKP